MFQWRRWPGGYEVRVQYKMNILHAALSFPVVGIIWAEKRILEEEINKREIWDSFQIPDVGMPSKEGGEKDKAFP